MKKSYFDSDDFIIADLIKSDYKATKELHPGLGLSKGDYREAVENFDSWAHKQGITRESIDEDHVTNYTMQVFFERKWPGPIK
jgi:hypothetical protein